MRADFQRDYSEIKAKLQEIHNELREIPTKRKLVVTKEESVIFPSSLVYKPRFRPIFKKMNRKTRKILVSIFDRMSIILKPYSPNNFVNLKDIIDTYKNNKKTLIFLLENNTYKTDEVFGDYLVEAKQNFFEISYIRRKEKRKILPNQSLNIDLNKIIKKDIILQIQNQFDSMWQMIEEEVERCEVNFEVIEKHESTEFDKLIKRLLNTKECEYLDFKFKMHEIQNLNKTTEVNQRKEFIKDVLGLVNNKSNENNNGKAYLLIGIGEKNEKYNGKHNNIEFNNKQLLIQLINEFITPHVDIHTLEFFISGNQNLFELSKEKQDDYDRCLLLKLHYQRGKVYEIKKDIGNPSLGIPYYPIGTSFTRDGSHTRGITQEDREMILKLSMQNRISNEYEASEDYESDEDYRSSPRYIANRTVNVDLIDNYIKILKVKRRSNENVLNIIESIRNEINKLYQDLFNKEEAISAFNRFITFSSQFFQEYDDQILRLILNMHRDFIEFEKYSFLKPIKTAFYDKLVDLYLKGNRIGSLIHILNYCGYYSDLFTIIIKAIKERDVELLKTVKNFKVEYYKKIDNKWDKIGELIDIKEEIDPSIPYNTSIIGSIESIIKIIEKVANRF